MAREGDERKKKIFKTPERVFKSVLFFTP